LVAKPGNNDWEQDTIPMRHRENSLFETRPKQVVSRIIVGRNPQPSSPCRWPVVEPGTHASERGCHGLVRATNLQAIPASNFAATIGTKREDDS
jgi:hypothetical protein